jgi:hypothetical protein
VTSLAKAFASKGVGQLEALQAVARLGLLAGDELSALGVVTRGPAPVWRKTKLSRRKSCPERPTRGSKSIRIAGVTPTSRCALVIHGSSHPDDSD